MVKRKCNTIFLASHFHLKSRFMRKVRIREQKKKKNGENCGPLMFLPVESLNCEQLECRHSCQRGWVSKCQYSLRKTCAKNTNTFVEITLMKTFFCSIIGGGDGPLQPEHGERRSYLKSFLEKLLHNLP